MKILLTMYFGPKNTIKISDIPDDVRFYHNKKSLDFYLDSDYEIYVVCTGCYQQYENFKIMYDDNINFYYVSQNNVSKEYGTSFLEVHLLRDFFRNKNSNDFYLKISGKYIVENISDVCNFLSDKKYSIGWKNFNLNLVDSRCIYINKKFIFSNFFDHVNDSIDYFFEHASFIYLVNQNKSSLKFIRFRPIVSGFSGTDGKTVSFSFFKKFIIYFFSLRISL